MILKNSTYPIITIAFFFSGANLMSLAFPILTKLILLVSIFLLIRLAYQNSNIKLNSLSLKVKFIMTIFFILFLNVNFSTLINSNSQMSLYNLIKYNGFIIICFLIFITISINNIKVAIRTYNVLVVFTAITGILGFILFYLNLLPLLSQHEIAPRQYNYYGLLWFIEKDSILSFGTVYINRLQSFFDEPGTYAFILIPTIIWYQFHNKNLKILLLLYLAFFFTFSIGGFISLFLFMILLFANKNISTIIIYCLIGALLTSFLFLHDDLVSLIVSFIDYKFGLNEFASEHTSGGERLNQFNNFIYVLSLNFMGIGIDSSSSVPLTSGILRDMLSIGVLGSILLTIMYILLFKMVLDYIKSDNYFLASIGFVLIMQGIQRASFNQSLLGLLFFVLFVKYKEFKIKSKL